MDVLTDGDNSAVAKAIESKRRKCGMITRMRDECELGEKRRGLYGKLEGREVRWNSYAMSRSPQNRTQAIRVAIRTPALSTVSTCIIADISRVPPCLLPTCTCMQSLSEDYMYYYYMYPSNNLWRTSLSGNGTENRN